MKRLIIVEDEPILSDYLANDICWSNIGVEVVGVADNGVDAIKKIIELNADCIITDINMPQMDGITMLKKLHEMKIKVSAVVLSGYSEFYMVKQAFQFGVSDYVLKSEMDEDVLLETMKQTIDKREENEDKIHNLIYKSNIINSVIFGRGEFGDNKAELRLSGKNMSVAVVKILNYSEELEEKWNGESELFGYGLMNIVEEILKNEAMGEAMLKNDDEIVFLMSDYNGKNAEKRTEAVLEKISKNIEAIFSVGTCVGYDGFVDDTEMLNELYNNAKCAIDMSFIYGRDKIICYSRLQANEKNIPDVNFKKQNMSFSTCMEKGNFEQAMDIINGYISTENVTLKNLEEFYEFCDICFFEINRVMKQERMAGLIRGEYKKIINCGRLEELVSYFRKNLLILAESSEEDVSLIPKIEKYIDDNYFKNISLESIAAEFKVGYQKLSRDFKKKTGETLKKYLIKKRMHEALKLIKNSDYMLYEIAEMVGYANYENFSRMFYSIYKKWPKDVER